MEVTPAEKALIAATYDDPSGFAVLVYADWLEERGRSTEADDVRGRWTEDGYGDGYGDGDGYGYGYGYGDGYSSGHGHNNGNGYGNDDYYGNVEVMI